MDSDSVNTRPEKETWTTVGKKPAVKKDKSSEGTASGIVGATKAAAAKAASSLAPAPPRKPEAIRIREEQLNRLKKKSAPLPEAMTKRSGSDSSTSSDSDERQASSQREKAFTKKATSAPAVKAPVKSSGNLQAALKKVDYKALSAELQKAKASGQPDDASLKLLANHLNEKLKDVPTDAAFYAENGFTWRYPLSAAPKELTQLLDSTFSVPKNLLEGYLDWLITDGCRNYLSKQHPIHGSQLIIQHLLSKNPDLISEKNLTERAADLKTFASRKDETIRNETLAILWAYGQAGIGSFSKGFDVWYKLMLPLLSDRRYTGLVVAYLQKLLENHKKPDFGKINKPEVFLNIFDAFFGKGTVHFHKSTKAVISETYQRLKTLLFKDKLRDNAVSYFAHFLMRLGQTQQSDKYRQAACENLVQCLKTDDKCLDVWRGKHQSSLKESQILLEHVLKNDDDDTKSVRRSKKFADFVDLVVEFEPANGNKDVPEGFAEENAQASELAKKLKKRMKKENSKSKLKRFILFIFFIAAAVSGEILYNTPKASYAIQGYNVVKPLAIEYWTVAKPAAVHAWGEYIKPFGYWAGVETLHLVKYSVQAAFNLWSSMKTNLPQVYAVILGVEDYIGQLTGQLASLCYQGLRKLDHFLVDMPPLSQMAEKAAPVFDYARERLSSGLVYAGHVVESYLAGNASTTSSSSDKTK